MSNTFMQGACTHECTIETVFPYAGIIRIRSTGMISASRNRSAPLTGAKLNKLLNFAI